MYLQLECLVYDEISLRNADLELSTSMERSEKFGLDDTPAYDYSEADDTALVLPIMIHIDDIKNIKSIISTYPVKRSKNKGSETIDLCLLSCRNYQNKNLDVITYDNIIGTPGEIVKRVTDFLVQQSSTSPNIS